MEPVAFLLAGIGLALFPQFLLLGRMVLPWEISWRGGQSALALLAAVNSALLLALAAR